MYRQSISRITSKPLKSTFAFASILVTLIFFVPIKSESQTEPFHLLEATMEDIHSAYRSGRLTSHQLVQLYLDRISAFDKKGPGLNAIVTINPKALEDASRLDAAFKASGFVGPLHGIPVILKDQMDAKGMPTTLGSILLAAELYCVLILVISLVINVDPLERERLPREEDDKLPTVERFVVLIFPDAEHHALALVERLVEARHALLDVDRCTDGPHRRRELGQHGTV